MHSAFDFLICIPLTVYHWMLEDVTCLEVVMDKSYVYAHPSQGVMMMAKAGIVDVPVSCSPPPKGGETSHLCARCKFKIPCPFFQFIRTRNKNCDKWLYDLLFLFELWFVVKIEGVLLNNMHTTPCTPVSLDLHF